MTTSDERTSSDVGRLARLGFLDAAAAARQLASPPLIQLIRWPEIVEAVGDSADPDQALLWLARLIEAQSAPERLVAALGEEVLLTRLLAVIGTSVGLAEHLVRRSEDWRLLATVDDRFPGREQLRAAMLDAVGADATTVDPVASVDAGPDDLRVAYRRALLATAVRDLAMGADVADVARELADLAAATLEAALALARAEITAAGADPKTCRLAVIGMGKCGGRELNYVSDVDVVFVAEARDGAEEVAALRTASRLAAALIRICSSTTSEGVIWEVDAALRPEGKAGPLVRTLASHRAYYARWAGTWEFQALLKARPVAGDLDLGAAYVDAVLPFVWSAAERDHFVEDVQAMRRRVEERVPRAEADRELKLGRGGLRDVEFSVQLLQLVHGRTDETLRSGSTLEALAALSDGGYVGRDDAAALAAAYRFLRTLEHRIQLHRLRRTHTLPTDPEDLRRLGRSLGHRSDPIAQLESEWRSHARDARRLHEKLFYRPLLNAVARLDSGDARLTPEAASVRLVALNFSDPAGALRHIEALSSGLSRRAAIQRTLLPVLLGWFADAPDPDAGLLAFRQVSDALGRTPWYLRMLRDEGAAAERMARLLATSRFATEQLLRAPEAVTMLAHDEELKPVDSDALVAETLAAVRRSGDPVASAVTVRGIRRRELFRVAAADVLLELGIDAVGAALTDVMAATVGGAFEAARRFVEAERRRPLPTRLGVIGMGRFGGGEIGYSSDADVLFVHDPLPGADERDAHDSAHAVAHEMRRLLAVPGPDPALLVDADLRPEGRQGPLVRTLGSYAAYYKRWSQVWEIQALLRARPVAGDTALGRRFVDLIDPLRYPAGGIADPAVREIRRIKARVEAERLPRGADPSANTKLGPGGLADVEWTIQLLQLQHASEVTGLRTTRTLEALEAAGDADLLSAEDVDTLASAWRLASSVRNAAMLVTGRPADAIPHDLRAVVGIAWLVGFGAGPTGAFLEDYRRVTRRARAVVDRVFYA